MQTWTLLPAAAGVLAIAVASPVAAQEQLNFAIGEDEFTVTIPEGYCLPTGEDKARANRAAAIDSQNVTPVDFQRCGSFGVSYTLIKSPRGFPPVRATRSEFLSGIRAELGNPNAIKEGLAVGQKDVSRGTGGQVKVDSPDYGYTGSDDLCVFLAGNLNISLPDGSGRNPRGATCVTLVGTRNIVVHSYDFDPDGASVEELQARSRAVAASVRAK